HVKPFPVRLSAAPQIDGVDSEIGRAQLLRCPSEIAAMRVEAGHDDDDAACVGVRTPRANEEHEPSRCLDSFFNGWAKLCIRHGCLLLTVCTFSGTLSGLLIGAPSPVTS